MLQEFEFNGVKSVDMGAVITAAPKYTAAVRDLTFTTISGRSGDIITDGNRYENVTITYEIATVPLLSKHTSQEAVYALTQWLYGTHEYAVLRDTYNVGYFRLAVCTGIADFTAEAAGVVTTTVTFNCKPWLYSDVGAQKLTYTLESTTSTYLYSLSLAFYNAEQWNSAPLITYTGGGTFAITITGDSTQSLTVGDIEEGAVVTIDKTEENVYDGDGTSRNELVSTYELPYFPAGKFTLTLAATTSYTDAPTVEITPNWRRL